MPEDDNQPPEVEPTEPAPETTDAAPTPEPIPDNFASLADAFKEQEPELASITKGKPTDPENADKMKAAEAREAKATADRGDDGKFKAKETLAAKPEEGEKKPETAPTGRDADLDTTKLDPHIRTPTRKVIEGYAAKAKEARDLADQREAARIKEEQRAVAAEEKLKTVKAPKEMEDELATLRTRVRELDISKDPALEQKYDAKIKSNSTSAMELLKEQGLFTKSGGEGKPPVEMNESEKKALTADIEKAGIGIRGMAKYIQMLEKGGEYEAAERLRAYAQHNDRLAQEKSDEVANWSKDYEGLQAQRARNQQQEKESYNKSRTEHGQRILTEGLNELVKKVPFLAPPEAVKATDSPEVKAAKEKAMGEFQANVKVVQDVAKGYDITGLPPAKAAEVEGKMMADAIKTIVYETQVLPRLLKEADEMRARIKELEAGEARIKKAGAINRAHSAAISQPNDKGKAPAADLSTADALAAIMAENGVASVN